MPNGAAWNVNWPAAMATSARSLNKGIATEAAAQCGSRNCRNRLVDWKVESPR